MSSSVSHGVLVVDDDPAMQKVLSLGLQRIGHHVTVARNGKEAIELLASGTIDPDCVLLDIRMPVMTGKEALPLIRAMKPLLPVIMLTAFNDLANGLESMKDGAFDYIVKPVRLDQLAEVIAKAMRYREGLLENADAMKRNEEYRMMLEQKVEIRTAELNDAYQKLRQTNIETVKVLAETIEAKDMYTQGHCMRVRMLSVEMAKAIGMEPELIEHLEYAALLHDIGKIGIPEKLLNKDGLLDPAELAVIRMHPVIGAQILSNVEFFAPCIKAVRQHHERWDGGGYPDGAAGEAIDPMARIIAVADSFDAMSSSRPYRAALPLEQALAEITTGAGTQFSPDVVRVFLEKNLHLKYSGDTR